MNGKLLLGFAAVFATLAIVLLALFLGGGPENGAPVSSGGGPAPAPDRDPADVRLGPDGDFERDAVANAVGIAPTPGELDARAAEALETERVDPRQTRLVGRVVDEAGAPLSGVEVELVAGLNLWNSYGAAAELGRLVVEDRHTTGADGLFEFDDVPAYGVQLVLALERDDRARVELPALRPVPGETVELGDLVLGRGGSLSGRVVDEFGLPVADARVFWALSPPDVFQWLLRIDAGNEVGTTDLSGAFEIEHLPAGDVRLAAIAPGSFASWSLPIYVSHGERIDDYELTTATARDVVGRVLSTDGQPLAADVWAVPEFDGAVLLRGSSDADGWFALPGGRPRTRYTVSALAPEHRRVERRRNWLPELGEPDRPVTLELPALVPWVVEVVDDLTGDPVSGAEVSWAGSLGMGVWGTERNGLRAGPRRLLGHTGSDGRFVAESVVDPDRSVVVRAAGYAPEIARPEGRATDPEVAELVVRVRLQRGTQLTVTVRAGDDPAAGADVELLQASEAFGSLGGRNRGAPLEAGLDGRPLLARASTDAEGVAVFVDLPRDTYAVAAVAPGYARTRSEPVAVPALGERVEVAIELPIAARLYGRVLVRGEPVADQRVSATLEDGPGFETRSGSDGTYALESLPPGAYRVVARRPTDATSWLSLVAPYADEDDDATENVVLLEGAELELDLEGQGSGATIAGTVRLNHEPRAGVSVRSRAIDEGGDEREGGGRNRWAQSMIQPRAHTGLDGEFELHGLLPGTWELWAESGGQRLARTELRVVDSDDVIEVDLSAETTSLELTGTVTGTDQVRSGLWLTLRPDPNEGGVPGFADDMRWSLRMNRRGEREVDDLPAGAYVIEGGDRDYVVVERSVVLVGGRPERVELEYVPRNPDPGPGD